MIQKDIFVKMVEFIQDNNLEPMVIPWISNSVSKHLVSYSFSFVPQTTQDVADKIVLGKFYKLLMELNEQE